jgi:hypothetical protein
MIVSNKYVRIVAAAAVLAAGLQASSAFAFVTCTPVIIAAGTVPACGASTGTAQITNSGTRITYSIHNNSAAGLASGVPVKNDGITPVSEEADTGGGTCNVVRAFSQGSTTTRTCHMTFQNDAKRYRMQAEVS